MMTLTEKEYKEYLQASFIKKLNECDFRDCPVGMGEEERYVHFNEAVAKLVEFVYLQDISLQEDTVRNVTKQFLKYKNIMGRKDQFDVADIRASERVIEIL